MGRRPSFLPFYIMKEVKKLIREVIFCFYVIDMTIKRGNEVPSEETGEGMRTKYFTLHAFKFTHIQTMFNSIEHIEKICQQYDITESTLKLF